MAESYTIIAYLIGNERYKQLLFKQYDNRMDVVREYRTFLNQYYKTKEFVMVMLNNEHKVLTAWALETPIKFIEASKIALNIFEKGEELYIDNKVLLYNVFGSQIYMEIIEQGKEMGVIPQDYVDPVFPTEAATVEAVSTTDEAAVEAASTTDEAV